MKNFNKYNLSFYLRKTLGALVFIAIFGSSISDAAEKTSIKVETFVVRQDAEGHGPNDLDIQVLKNLESYLVDRSVEKARDIMKTKGITGQGITRDDFRTSSHLIELGGQKLGVVDIVSKPIKIKMVLAFRENELVRVNCVLQGNGEIPLTWGPCAKQIENTFKVQFPKVNRN